MAGFRADAFDFRVIIAVEWTAFQIDCLFLIFHGCIILAKGGGLKNQWRARTGEGAGNNRFNSILLHSNRLKLGRYNVFDLIKDAIEAANRFGLPIPTVILFRIPSLRADRWSEREKYYYDILKNLGIWKDTLSDSWIIIRNLGRLIITTILITSYFKSLGERVVWHMSR